jgi:hypothetical protein
MVWVLTDVVLRIVALSRWATFAPQAWRGPGRTTSCMLTRILAAEAFLHYASGCCVTDP